MQDLTAASAVQIADLIKTKKVRCVDVMQAYLDRIAQVNPRINAITKQLPPEQALEQAKAADTAVARNAHLGKLHGLPITIKDGRRVKGFLTTLGTQSHMNSMATEDSTLVARLRAEGAIIVGVTNLPDFSMSYETDNMLYGRTNNPYDLNRSPGGSSGGEAAIIAAGGSTLGIGADSGGSIREPAHNCGIAGLKPSRGLLPSTGKFPADGWGIFSYIDSQGPLARYVEDLMLVLPILAGPDGKDPYALPIPLQDPSKVQLKSLRVAFYSDNGVAKPTKETIDMVNNAAKALSKDVAKMTEAYPQISGDTFREFEELFFYGGDGGKWLLDRKKEMGVAKVAEPFQAILDRAAQCEFSTSEFRKRLLHVDQFKFAMMNFMRDYDVILCPVATDQARRYEEKHQEQHASKLDIAADLTYCFPANITGWPATTVRCGTSAEGMPLGIQVIANVWRDDISLAVAKRLETLLGGWQKPRL